MPDDTLDRTAATPPGENGLAAEHLVLVGASHRTAPLSLLESIALAPEEIVGRLPELARRARLHEALLLSTCNRTEIYGTTGDPEASARELESWLLARSGNPSGLGPEHIFTHRDRDAAGHLFSVTCGIDSLIVGETQVAGQVQEALEVARRAGTAGGYMARLLARASRACKRARTETAVGSGIVSVAAAAVHLAHRVFGDLGRRAILVVGAGETGRLAARHFREHRPQALYIANRTLSRAEEIARELSATAVPLEHRLEFLARADVVVCATRAPEPLFRVAPVREVMRARSARMVLFVDVSLPHNVDRGVARIDNVFLHDMNDLRSIVEQNLARRAKELPAVERIVMDEVDAFVWREGRLEAGPLIRELRESFEAVRRSELERFRRRLRDEDVEIVERLTRDLVKKLLHRPTVELQALARDPEAGADRLSWVRRLFHLNGGSGEGGPP